MNIFLNHIQFDVSRGKAYFASIVVFILDGLMKGAGNLTVHIFLFSAVLQHIKVVMLYKKADYHQCSA